jgi:glycoprotein endo-alpha-1,2-mannosidase
MVCWTPSVNDNYRKDPYIAPLDPGITYYPAKGLYSSNDPVRLSEQMNELHDAGVDVVAVSWWGSRLNNTSVDGQGVGSDHCMNNILDAAAKHGVKVAFHLEPYANRDVRDIRDDLTYIFAEYGQHSAFYRHPITDQGLIYLYDSYQLPVDQWKSLLSKDGSLTIRGTSIDCIAIGLVLDDTQYLVSGGFDGAYSYFAATGFTQASTPSHWRGISERLAEHGLVFIPSVAPGYDDTRLRQWNGQNKRDRQHGQYYSSMWQDALLIHPAVIAITSVNEWGEGSQIEPAKSFVTDKGVKLIGYSEDPDSSDEADQNLYLDLTRQWSEKFKGVSVTKSKHPDL